MKKLLPLCVLVLSLGVGQAHAAAILQIDGAGFLTGATGVMVDGTAYDVSFQAGSCNSVFNGCDPAVDLLFTSAGSALAASQALLDQVFLGEFIVGDIFAPGLFDYHPGLTQGCTDASFNVCLAQTPYGFGGGSILLLGIAANYGPVTELIDEALLGSMVGGGTATTGIQTFAVWSVSPSPVTTVPEPSTVALLGAGLLGLVRRARRIARAQ